MFRAFAFAVVVAVCSACGEEPTLYPDTQPASFYAYYLGVWSGGADGATTQRQPIHLDLTMVLGNDGDSVVLDVSCGGTSISIPAYEQTRTAIHFNAEPIRCPVRTPCGDGEGRLGGITLLPAGERVAARVALGLPGCFGAREEVVLMGGVLDR